MTEQLVADSRDHDRDRDRDGLTAVLDAIVSAAGNAGVDDVVLARLRCLQAADQDTLLKPPAELGLDSLTWLEVLTVLEERFDVLLPDEVVVTPESRTVLGLARALADCRRAGR